MKLQEELKKHDNVEVRTGVRVVSYLPGDTFTGITVEETATGERTMEDAVIGIVLQKEKIREKLARLEALEQEMMSIFGRLADPAQRQLMTLRYVKERSWLYIAEKLNISRATVYRLHEAALREVEKLYEEERSARGKGGTASG